MTELTTNKKKIKLKKKNKEASHTKTFYMPIYSKYPEQANA